MKIEQYDTVRLKDGRIGTAVEVFEDDEILVDIGSSPKDWETISAPIDEIESVIVDEPRADYNAPGCRRSCC